MGGSRCLKCAQPLTHPRTPAEVWGRGRIRRGLLCAACLSSCRGSLLYSVPGPELRAYLRGLSDEDYRRWLGSLGEIDRQAVGEMGR